MNPRLFTFVAGATGPWRVVSMQTLVGDPLAGASKLAIHGNDAGPADGAQWTLRGVTSNERYVERSEKEQLVARQQGLGRPDSTCAALIPIRKSATWWGLPQDERRQILEQRSAHIQTGLKYLPAIARRLHHCRDLGAPEPFDFITWFEFAPTDAPAFDRLLKELRASEEWKYIDREVDIRLVLE